MPINILIADDHAIVRIGLRKILEAQQEIIVAGEAADGREAIALSLKCPCDVMIMDIAMPGINGIDATRSICEGRPEIRIIIHSMYDTCEHIYRAFQAGARGYLLKGVAGDEIVPAIRAVMRGELYYGKGVAPPAPSDHSHAKSPIDRLTHREREVLQLVVEGRSSAEIATILSLAEKTPEVYRCRIMKKLGIRNTPALVKFAICHGVTSLE